MQPQSPNREQEVPKNGVPNGGAPFSNRIVQTDVDVSLRSSTLQQTAGVELQTKPNTVEGNNRSSISWIPGREIPGNIFEHDDNLSLLSSPDKNKSRDYSVDARMREIIEHNPLECEAETYILKALETTDPTQPGPNDAQTSILGGVPLDACHIFTSDSKQETQNRIDRPMPIKTRNTTSTAEDLFNLTADVMKMQAMKQQHRDEDTLGTSADSLVKNATRLLHRHSVNKSTVDGVHPPDSLAASVKTTNTGSHWKKVKAAVKVAGVANDAAAAKKRDEVTEIAETLNEESGNGNVLFDVETGTIKEQSLSNSSKRRKKNGINRVKTGFQEFEDWVMFEKTNMYVYLKLLLFVIIPATGISAILFYWADNPPCGTYKECLAKKSLEFNQTVLNQTADNSNLFEQFWSDSKETAVSWWILFIFVRHILVVSLAAMSQSLIIDFLCMRSRIILKAFGPMVTLYTVQSKGWPFIITFWGIFSFFFLFGGTRFADNWLFWQDYIDMFNSSNASGGVTALKSYRTMLILAVAVGISVSFKRFWVGLFLGRQTFQRYAADLAVLMRKVLQIGQVASLSKEIEQCGYKLSDFNFYHESFSRRILDEDRSVDLASPSDLGRDQNLSNPDVGAERVFGLQKDFSGSSARIKIEKLLGGWEEPKEFRKSDEKINISAIIQFRTSLACLNTHLPFSSAFGPASTRQECVESSEIIFRRLLLATPGENVLSFDVIASIAVGDDGQLDETKVKELIKLFRPDREGNLSLIDFVKSVDAVYKELRLLRASVINNSRMDRAFERIINCTFYFILGCVVLSVIGIDPLVLFASVSGFVLGFAFMIGAACSKYFEGLLLILVRRPYDIGDRIHVGDPNSEANANGSSTWFVRDVGLFTTTVCYAATNEVATYSNGSLASSRIINAARSPEASIFFLLKFPISASYEKLKIFRNVLEDFVRARPREYLAFSGFRCSRVEADSGFVEYVVAVTHRESWQNLRTIANSKAELASFALELAKKMNLRFKTPPMPIDLRMNPATLTAFGGDPANYSQALADDDCSHVFDEGDINAVKAIFDKK